MSDILFNYGGSIKTLETKGDLITVGDYGILWGTDAQKDLVGDWFTRDTILGATKGLGVDTMLHHGLPLSKELAPYATQLLPATVKAETDDHGLLVATVLDMRDSYQRKIRDLVEEKALSWSSGANPRGVLRRDGVKFGEIVQWPLMEFSFTPTPCEPRMQGIHPMSDLKAFAAESPEFAKSVQLLVTGEVKAAVEGEVADIEAKGIFDNVAAEVTGTVLRGLFERLMYVVYDALSYNSESVEIGMSTLVPRPLNERVEFVNETVQQFADRATAIISALLQGEGDEDVEAAAKSFNPEAAIKELEAGLLGGLRLEDHSEKVLETNQGLYARLANVVALQAGDRKSGRAISKANYERIEKLLGSLQPITDEMRQLLEEHGPQDGAPEEGKAIDAEILDIEMKFLQREEEIRNLQDSPLLTAN